MEAEHLISEIIRAHENNDDFGVRVTESLRLEPQLSYSGKMAREAYDGWKYHANANRDYVGILDFKIIQNGLDTEHETNMIAPSVRFLELQEIRRLRYGEDPFAIPTLSGKKLEIACCLQAGFVEQEINWGVEDFQVWSRFGRPESKNTILLMSSPRDFLGVFLERCYAEYSLGKSWRRISEEVILPFRRRTSTSPYGPIRPPIDFNDEVFPDFEEYMPAFIEKKRSDKWITPHLGGIRRFCEKVGPNPVKAVKYVTR